MVESYLDIALEVAVNGWSKDNQNKAKNGIFSKIWSLISKLIESVITGILNLINFIKGLFKKKPKESQTIDTNQEKLDALKKAREKLNKELEDDKSSFSDNHYKRRELLNKTMKGENVTPKQYEAVFGKHFADKMAEADNKMAIAKRMMNEIEAKNAENDKKVKEMEELLDKAEKKVGKKANESTIALEKVRWEAQYYDSKKIVPGNMPTAKGKAVVGTTPINKLIEKNLITLANDLMSNVSKTTVAAIKNTKSLTAMASSTNVVNFDKYSPLNNLAAYIEEFDEMEESIKELLSEIKGGQTISAQVAKHVLKSLSNSGSSLQKLRSAVKGIEKVYASIKSDTNPKVFERGKQVATQLRGYVSKVSRTISSMKRVMSKVTIV